MLKNGHLLRFPHPSSLRRTAKYASLLRISGALHLAIFEQPGKEDFFNSQLRGGDRSVRVRPNASGIVLQYLEEGEPGLVVSLTDGPDPQELEDDKLRDQEDL